MDASDQIIHSLGELIDAVTPSEPDRETGRRRDTGVYHGSSHAERPLLTSLDRLGGSSPPHTKAHLEGHLLRNFMRYSRPYLLSEPTSEWEHLAIAQHHGAPTRLLDWSYSPLVAAHFATRDRRARGDRVIWRLDWQSLHRAYGLPCLALLIDDLRELLGRGRPFSPWNLFAGETEPFACMIEPPALHPRLTAQSAVFTLCSDATRSFDHFLEEQGLGSLLRRFVIPARSVHSLRDQLDMVGIDERRLFPGLDGVAASLRQYYG